MRCGIPGCCLPGASARLLMSLYGYTPISADIPSVGKHMYDNPRNGISFIPSVPVDHSLVQVVAIPSANGTASYLEAASYIVPLAPASRPSVLSLARLLHSMLLLQLSWKRFPDHHYLKVHYGFLKQIHWRVPPCASTTWAVLRTWHDVLWVVRHVAEVLEGRALDGFRPAVGSTNGRGSGLQDCWDSTAGWLENKR